MAALSALPLVGVTACYKVVGLHPFHIAGDKYLRAVAAQHGSPLIIPSLADPLAAEALLERIDGLLLTGSPSNIEPCHYGGGPGQTPEDHDPDRDATTLPLIRKAVTAGLPVLGICRGFQELNVSLGGTLHQALHLHGGFLEHREDKAQEVDDQYDLAHSIKIQPGGVLADLWPDHEVEVNSLHGQGVDNLGPGLKVEALAPDGLVEAFSAPDAPGFVLGVQWHPEWKVAENSFYQAIFTAFIQACRAHMTARSKAKR